VYQKSLGVDISNSLLFHVLEYWLKGIAFKGISNLQLFYLFQLLGKDLPISPFSSPEFLLNTKNMSQK